MERFIHHFQAWPRFNIKGFAGALELSSSSGKLFTNASVLSVALWLEVVSTWFWIRNTGTVCMDMLGISSIGWPSNGLLLVPLSFTRLETGCTSLTRIRSIFLKVCWNCGFMIPYMKGLVRLLQNTK